jgi:hypothetical protein
MFDYLTGNDQIKFAVADARKKIICPHFGGYDISAPDIHLQVPADLDKPTDATAEIQNLKLLNPGFEELVRQHNQPKTLGYPAVPARILGIPISVIVDLAMIVLIQNGGKQKLATVTLIVPTIVGFVGDRVTRQFAARQPEPYGGGSATDFTYWGLGNGNSVHDSFAIAPAGGNL